MVGGMKLNKKLKCLLSAVLVLIMLMSAAIAMPATAAKSDETTQAPTETVAADAAVEETTAVNQSDIFLDGRTDLADMADGAEDVPQEITTDGLSEKPIADLAEVGASGSDTGVNGSLGAYREGFYTNQITIKWKKLKDVSGYRVYWLDLLKDGAKTKLLTTTTDRCVTVKSLKAGSKFRFTIKPYHTADGKTAVGLGESLIAATVPAPVRSFRLASGAVAGTLLKWTRTVGIDGYIILRQYQGVWKEYKYLGPNVTQFRDTNVKEGHAYYYKIMTYRKDTRGELRSSKVLLRTVCGLSAPGDNGSSSRVNRVYLNWRKIDSASGYQVWYSLDHKTYKGLADIQSNTNTFTTKKFTEGTKVWFRVRPYRLVGASKTRVVGTIGEFAVKVLANSFGADVGDTYIEIDISDQHMWYIVKGNVFVSTDVVTGNYDSSDTPKGVYYINNKARNINLVGADYVSFVEYWMAFIGGSYGIHDASWRSSFGGSIYKGNGSHGCVNTPYEAVKKIYNNVSVGTPVVIHG